jgi:hypothetical protein
MEEWLAISISATIRAVVIIVIIVHVIRIVLVIIFVPVKHALAVFEMFGNMVDAVLARNKSVGAEAAFPSM